MTYKEFLDADRELNDAYKKAKIVKTGTKIVGWGLRSQMVSCYEANYNGKTVTFDDASYFPDDTIADLPRGKPRGFLGGCYGVSYSATSAFGIQLYKSGARMFIRPSLLHLVRGEKQDF